MVSMAFWPESRPCLPVVMVLWDMGTQLFAAHGLPGSSKQPMSSGGKQELNHPVECLSTSHLPS